MLRSGALRDPEVMRVLDERFVLVWIDVRTTPLPTRTWVKDVLLNASMDDRRMIEDPFSKGFFLRSVALAPDGDMVLNPNSRTIAGAMGQIAMGSNSYAVTDPGDYLSMLRKSLERLDDLEHGRTTPGSWRY